MTVRRTRRRWARACVVWLTLAAGPALAALAGCGHPGSQTSATAAPAERADLILVYSGDMDGNLQPCGCHRNTSGGLPRRATVLAKVRSEGAPVAVVEYGNQFTAEDQIATSLDALAEMKYDAVALGERDPDWLARILKGSAERGLVVLDEYAASAAKTGSVERGGKRIAFVSFTEPRPGAKPPTVAERASRLKAARANHDLVAVFSYLPVATEQAVLRAAPGTVDILIPGSRGWGLVQPMQENGVWTLPTSFDAQKLGIARLRWTEGGLRVSVTQEVLDRNWRDDEAVGALVRMYNEQRGDRVGYVAEQVLELGTEQCSHCHASSYRSWHGSSHAFALNKLSQTGQTIGDCLRCHSSTYRHFKVLTRNPYVQGVECIDCHPKAQEHQKDAIGKSHDPDSGVHEHKLHPLSTETPPLSPAMCITCHTQKEDPNFDFSEYWLRIRHREGR